MWFSSVIALCRPGAARAGSEKWLRGRGPQKPVRPRLVIEPLEERTVPSFLPAVNYHVGASPNTVAVGDFNGDHKLDIVTANSGSNTVSVLLGNGNGTFKPATNYVADSGTNYVAVGDFNGDDKLDIVTLNVGAHDLSVLLGNGDGTFQAPKNFFLPHAPNGDSQVPLAVAVGDVNHDGKLDLVVTAQGLTHQVGYVDVLLGNGNGTFSPRSIYQLAEPPPQYSLALADVLGAGTLDIVVSNFNGKSISLFAGKGDGTFRAPLLIATGSNPTGIAVGDLNGDGKKDLVVADDSGNGSITVLLNKGSGSFQAQNYTVGHNPDGVVLADFNHDGKRDIATDNVGDSNVSLLLGNGNGTFLSAQNYPTDSTPWWIARGDFNGDGYPDLVTVNRYAAAPDVSVLLNNRIWTAPTALVSALAPPDTAKPTAQPSTVPAAVSVDARAPFTAIFTSRDLAAPKAGILQRIISAHAKVAALDQLFETPAW
jgi:hypothetical protein